jgi:Zn-finger nucleic acid-binding protein
MKCPRDNVELATENYRGIEVEHCLTCHGRWLDYEELDELEATVPSTEAQRAATIEYARHESEINCPVCGKQMIAFDYRAYSLELDTCEEKHGFWLDAGEEGRIRDIIEERVRGLQRSGSAEAAWGSFLQGLRGTSRESVFDKIGDLFRRR